MHDNHINNVGCVKPHCCCLASLRNIFCSYKLCLLATWCQVERTYNMASNSIGKPPEPLNLEDRAHHGENWKNFKREWSYYEIAAGIATKTEKIRVAALLNVIGRDALDMYETVQWGIEGDNFKIAKVLEKFEECCVPARNKIFERYNFFTRNQDKGKLLDAYITTLLKLSETCAFGDLRESLVRDRLVYGIRDDHVRVKLLGKRDLDLDTSRCCGCGNKTLSPLEDENNSINI